MCCVCVQHLGLPKKWMQTLTERCQNKNSALRLVHTGHSSPSATLPTTSSHVAELDHGAKKSVAWSDHVSVYIMWTHCGKKAAGWGRVIHQLGCYLNTHHLPETGVEFSFSVFKIPFALSICNISSILQSLAAGSVKSLMQAVLQSYKILISSATYSSAPPETSILSVIMLTTYHGK